MLDKAKLAYDKTTNALTKPIHFWLSPAGILFVVGIIWLVTLFAEPIILSDRPTNIADIAGTRLWLLDKAIYILTIFAAAYWAQHLLHKNAEIRDNKQAEIEACIQLSNGYSILFSDIHTLTFVNAADAIEVISKIRAQLVNLIAIEETHNIKSHYDFNKFEENLIPLNTIAYDARKNNEPGTMESIIAMRKRKFNEQDYIDNLLKITRMSSEYFKATGRLIKNPKLWKLS